MGNLRIGPHGLLSRLLSSAASISPRLSEGSGTALANPFVILAAVIARVLCHERTRRAIRRSRHPYGDNAITRGGASW